MKVYLPVEYFQRAGYITKEAQQDGPGERFNERVSYAGGKKSMGKQSIAGDV